MNVFLASRKLTFSKESNQSELVFFQQLMTKLVEQTRSGELCDVAVRVKRDRIHCHKSVLGANSPYFFGMFTSDFAEKQSKEIDLSEVFSSISPLKAITDFMYTGNLELDNDIVEEVLNGGTLFLMDAVRDHCAHYLLVNLGMQNVLYTWELAERFSLKTLGRVCRTVAMEHLQNCLVHVRDVGPLSATVVEVLLRESSKESDRKEMCKFLFEWIDEEHSSRHRHMLKFLTDNKDNLRFHREFLTAIGSPGKEKSNNSGQMVLVSKKACNVIPPTKEFIVFHKVQETAAGSHMLKLYAHSGQQNFQWNLLAETKLDPVVAHSLTNIIGFVGCKAVFGSVDSGKVKLVDLKTSESCTVSLLEEDGVNDIRRTILYSCFCFDNRLFCIQKNKNNYFFSCAYTLKQYNPALGMWSMVAELPLTEMEMRDEVEFQVRSVN